MEHSLNKIKLKVTPIYTLTGVKYLYTLKDMAYGEWLIYQENKPRYYFNLFDKEYSFDKNQTGKSIEKFLETKLDILNVNLTIKQNIFGIKGSRTFETWQTIERLPYDFFK